MACCLTALLLFGRVTSGFSWLWSALTGQPRSDRRTRPAEPPIGTWSHQSVAAVRVDTDQRGPGMWRTLGLLASLAVEIGLAALLWHWWKRQAGNVMMDHSAMGDHSSMAGGPAPALILIIASLEVALVIATRMASQRRTYGGIALTGMAIVALSFSLSVSGSSHIVDMTEMVVLTTVVPVAFVVVAKRSMPGRTENVAAHQTINVPQLVLAVAAALALPAAVFVWHLPSLHHEMSQTLVACRGASYLLFGMALWYLVTSGKGAALPERTRAKLLGLAYGTIGIVALAMIVGPESLMPGMDMGLPWGAVTDQRVGGLLMMLGDTLLVLPVISSSLAPEQRESQITTAARTNVAQRELEFS